jgi:glycerol-3-phosphate O-acyltransferase
VAVAGATSVSATVLLGLPHAACRQDEFVTRALALSDFLARQKVRFTASLERNVQASFRENIAFLESGGLIRRLAGEPDVLHVPPEKRLALDFYKNNTIHFFLLSALLVEALSRGVHGGALKDDVLWWLDLFRWEFPLPEREDIAANLGTLMTYCEEHGVLRASNGHHDLHAEHPFVRSTIGLLDNFRESYWVAAQALAGLPDDPSTRKAVLELMSKRYAAGLLLGEVRKPEGNSSMTLGNALNRFAELGCVRVRPGKGREQLIDRGERFADLATIAQRIAPRVVLH